MEDRDIYDFGQTLMISDSVVCILTFNFSDQRLFVLRNESKLFSVVIIDSALCKVTSFFSSDVFMIIRFFKRKLCKFKHLLNSDLRIHFTEIDMSHRNL